MGGGGSKPKSLETRRRDRRIARNRAEESALLSIDDSNRRSIKKYKQYIPDKYQQFKQSFNDRRILQSTYKSLLKELKNIRQYVRKLEEEIKILNKQRNDAKKLTKGYKEEIKRLNDIIRALNTIITYWCIIT